MNGRRLYDGDMIRRIDVLRFAQQAGFTLDEIKTLFHGFGSSTPLSVRWQKLAHEKLKELDALQERVQNGCDGREFCLRLAAASYVTTSEGGKSRRLLSETKPSAG